MNAMTFYRVGHYCYRRGIPLVPRLTDALTFLLANSSVPHSAQIGPESKLAYFGIGVVVHRRAKIGRRVVIGQNVTIGRQLDPDTIPEIGDNVYISAGARILGAIKVGSNVIIGANAVVIHDVPDNSIVAGVPARVIRTVEGDIYALLKNVYPV
ncbi:MAG: serine acetyltransferase [Proteobacteria bacterium]|nr:serine acetyltransferase [Pseudomonadota bacterium]